jgi:hypothetical protein
MALPDGDHCLRCRHVAKCVLPQRLEGRVCGWYNAQVDRFVRRERPKHRVTEARLATGKE